MSLIDRIKYIAEMKALLSFMDEADRKKVLRRYERIFDEAGEAGEMDVIRLLGSPVRQILQVEKEYREREEAGLPGIGEEYQTESDFVQDTPPQRYAPPAYPAPPEEETLYAAPEDTFAAPAPEPAQENEEPLDEPEDDFALEEPADEPEAAPSYSFTPAAPPAVQAFAAAFEMQQQSAEPRETLPEEEPSEEPFAELPEEAAAPLAPPPVAVRAPAVYDIDEEDDEEYEEAQPVSAGRVVGAVFLTPVMILLALFGIVLTLALSAIGLAPGVGMGASTVYLALYALAGMSYLPDMLMVLGSAVVSLALAIFFLWLGIWLLVEGVALTIRVISRIYGRVLRKGGRSNV